MTVRELIKELLKGDLDDSVEIAIAYSDQTVENIYNEIVKYGQESFSLDCAVSEALSSDSVSDDITISVDHFTSGIEIIVKM